MKDSEYNVVEVAVPVPVRSSFSYLSKNQILPGTRVKVSFGSRSLIGVVISSSTKPNFQKDLKSIDSVLDDKELLNKKDIELISWLSNYYKTPIGEVAKLFFPPSMRKEIEIPDEQEIFELTQKGEFYSEDLLKKSPKQLEMLSYFRKEKTATRHGLKSISYDSRILRELIKKELISKKKIKYKEEIQYETTENFLELNNEQKAAYESFKESLGSFKVHLLFGVTGSGKTETYMHIVRDVLENHKQVAVLVPEIGLTGSLEKSLKSRFGNKVVTMHSSLSNKDRQRSWKSIQSSSAKIILGTRSSIFTSTPDLGLIIVDEEHDSSYKQNEMPCYSARDTAIYKAKLHDCPVVLASATPSLESFNNAKLKKYALNKLEERVSEASKPKLELIDLRGKEIISGLATNTIAEIKKELTNGNQVMIFQNRRGYSPVVVCESCGWSPNCQNCDVRMVYHKQTNKYSCHHCGYAENYFQECKVCPNNELSFYGAGTEKLEESLRTIFPDFPILRIDSDISYKKDLNTLLAQPLKGEPMILVGTQILAKGHHLPDITLVVILDGDFSLYSLDFRATERMNQLITQVSGRSGRGNKSGKVLIQTFVPEHPSLEKVVDSSYETLAENLLQDRNQNKLPPFYHSINLITESTSYISCKEELNKIRSMFVNPHIDVIGPQPCIIEKRKNIFRWQISAKSKNRTLLHNSLNRVLENHKIIGNKVRLSIDVDPL